MQRQTKIRRGGFTLVEMMVVIAIIAILASILVPTLSRVSRKGRETRIGKEVGLLQQNVEAYKQKYDDYPPDFTDINVVIRHLRKAFPRHKEVGFVNTNMTLPDGRPAQQPDGTPFDPANLDPSEALVFWLGMLKDDSRNPLNGDVTPAGTFTFDQTRLVDLDGDGWPSYVPPDGSDAPYVYFDSRTYGDAADSTTWAAYNHAATAEVVRPYFFQVPESTAPAKWANEGTFQIISAGLDGEFGMANSSGGKVFPFGLYYTSEDLDNITDFNENKPLRDNPGYER